MLETLGPSLNLPLPVNMTTRGQENMGVNGLVVLIGFSKNRLPLGSHVYCMLLNFWMAIQPFILLKFWVYLLKANSTRSLGG